MEKEKKDKIKKTLIFVFIVVLLVLIHITNFQDIRGFERSVWSRYKSFYVSHRWLAGTIDVVIAIVILTIFKDKSTTSTESKTKDESSHHQN